MNRRILFFTVVLSVMFMAGPSFSSEDEKMILSPFYLSEEAEALLEHNGFVVVGGNQEEIYDIYDDADESGQPVFVTTDLVLHTGHIFFDYLLRILEVEELSDAAKDLTDRMLVLSIDQYESATDPDVKEAALLNIGYFSVAKKIIDPAFEPGYGLDEMVDAEIENITAHEGLKFRELLPYVENPDLETTPYAYEDYSQYVPRGHYTRNETFETYFLVMMWYGRIDFKLTPGKNEDAKEDGRMMTLQALLITDALANDGNVFDLWKRIYEPTTYFVGKADDLTVYDYRKLADDIFPKGKSVDRYAQADLLSTFIEGARKLNPPKILSGAAFTDDGEFDDTTMGFRFMGQRFIPDSYMFQQLVYGVKDLGYTGEGDPLTMEYIPNVGPARAFPRGLDVMAVLGSERAYEILQQEGDTDYLHYDEQFRMLKEEFTTRTEDEWTENLYWRWLYALLPLLEEPVGDGVPAFMKSEPWLDKSLATSLGSWTELRHDTILYAKQSYTMMGKGLPMSFDTAYGYVEPYPEVYARLGEMMADIRLNLDTLGIAPEGVPEKLAAFETLLSQLETISQKELRGDALSDEEYRLIADMGGTLERMTDFPDDLMEKITSDTDSRMDIIADVHTDLNTGKVLEEGVGSPFDIYVIVDDAHGKRVCRGGVFSYYEFKHPLSDRLTDEKWQEMGEESARPPQPEWIRDFTVR
ncbi:MAG: DUF3160 domain-containing protein [Deltaproteobacteria bacterium]|nr:DUF3160 domain-containing protein [Candidatus Zymogenaceae bacterium]